MKIILLVDVKKVGKKHDIVEVKDGYGNFLIQSGKAIVSSEKAKAIVDSQKATEKAKYDEEVANANLLKTFIEKDELHFTLKTNNGQAFGSISNKQIIDELAKKNIKIDKFMLSENKNNSYGLGSFKIAIRLHKDVLAHLVVRITGE